MAFTWSELGRLRFYCRRGLTPFHGSACAGQKTEWRLFWQLPSRGMLWIDYRVSSRLEVNKLGFDDENSSYTIHQDIKYNPWKACLSVLTCIFCQGKLWSLERRFLKSTSQLNNLILPLIADNKLRKQYCDIGLFVEGVSAGTAGWQSGCVGAVPRTVTRGIWSLLKPPMFPSSSLLLPFYSQPYFECVLVIRPLQPLQNHLGLLPKLGLLRQFFSYCSNWK